MTERALWKKEWCPRNDRMEEIDGTRKGFLEERVGDYRRKGHVEEIDGAPGWDLGKKQRVLEGAMGKIYCRRY